MRTASVRCAKCNAIDTAHACGYRLPPSLRVKTSQRVSYQLLRRRFDRSLAINLYIHLENELKGFVLIHLAVPTKGTHVCKHACTHKHPTQYTVSTYVRTQRPISCAASSCLMTQMSCAKRCTATSFPNGSAILRNYRIPTQTVYLFVSAASKTSTTSL